MNNFRYDLSFRILLIFWASTYFWYFNITSSSQGLQDFIKESISSLPKTFSNENKDQRLVFNQFKKQTDGQALNKYVTLVNNNSLLPGNINYQLKPVTPTILPYHYNPTIIKFISNIGQFLTKIPYLLITIGTIYLLLSLFGRIQVNPLFIIGSLGNYLLIISVIIVPFLSIGYDMDRVYLQSLIVLSIAAIIGFNYLTKHIVKNNLILLSIYFSLYFLFYTGVIYQIVGGYYPSMQFNNYGDEYDAMYLHKTEIKSIEWLSANYDGNSEVVADNNNTLKIRGNNKNIFLANKGIIIPSIIYPHTYIYMGYTNINKNKGFVWLNSKYIGYSLTESDKYINENKNLIYSNSGSKIFR